MENVEQEQPNGADRAIWTIKAPAGQTVDVETRIIEDRPDELIAWRSVEGRTSTLRGVCGFATPVRAVRSSRRSLPISRRGARWDR
jgi:uncharacterized membrane protein